MQQLTGGDEFNIAYMLKYSWNQTDFQFPHTAMLDPCFLLGHGWQYHPWLVLFKEMTFVSFGWGDGLVLFGFSTNYFNSANIDSFFIRSSET